MSSGIVAADAENQLQRMLYKLALQNLINRSATGLTRVMTHGGRVGTRLLPLLWASSCDVELTATLQSEQYRRRRALPSSVSGSVSASGSASASGSGSEGELTFSSPPTAEVVSGAEAAVELGTNREATGASVGVAGVARGCVGLSKGESGRGVAPGFTSAGRKQIIHLES